MTLANLLAITGNPHLSALIWVLVLLLVLYLGRVPFHRVVAALGRAAYRAARLSAAAVDSLARQLALRNRNALFAAGRVQLDRLIAREFERIPNAVLKQLHSYPRVHRQLSEIIARLDDDCARSAEVPPGLPEWIPVIRSIAEIEPADSGGVAGVLQEIQRGLTAQHEQAVETYRQATARRHRVLARMVPLWRKVDRRLQQVDGAMRKLSAQARIIDRYMGEYEAICRRDESVEGMLRAGALKQFFIAALMLMVAMGTAWLNYQVIIAAFTSMDTANAWPGGLSAAPTAALVLVLTQMGLGVFLMESLRVTHLFPIIGSMEDGMRRRFVALSAALLATLAGLVCFFVWSSPAGAVDGAQAITRVGPLVLGASLPVVLVFSAIPLESFATSVRTPAGLLAGGLLTLVVVVLRLLGNVAVSCATFLVSCYDIAIFPAVWLEDAIVSGRRRPTSKQFSPSSGKPAAIDEAVSGPTER